MSHVFVLFFRILPLQFYTSFCTKFFYPKRVCFNFCWKQFLFQLYNSDESTDELDAENDIDNLAVYTRLEVRNNLLYQFIVKHFQILKTIIGINPK